MVSNSAPKGKLDPKVFDFNHLMSRTKAPTPEKVSVFLRADLVGRIKELDALLNAVPDEDPERAIGDPLPADEYGAEYDALVEDFNASEVVFEFRAKKLSDVTNARAAMARDHIDLEGDEANEWAINYMLAEQCTNATMTGAEWGQWREEIGETAFFPLVAAMVSANMGAGVSAPFSQRPSPGLTSEK